MTYKSMTTDSCTFCHRCALQTVPEAHQILQLIKTNSTTQKRTHDLTTYRIVSTKDNSAIGTALDAAVEAGCSPEDLDEGDLQRGNFAMHEDARQVQLHLETHVHIGAVDGGGPPQCEPPVGDLVQPRALRVGEFLVLHALLKAAGLLPEETLPRGEIGSLEQSVLQDTLHQLSTYIEHRQEQINPQKGHDKGVIISSRRRKPKNQKDQYRRTSTPPSAWMTSVL